MIDTHAHLDFGHYDLDREAVIQRAFESKIKAIINIGTDLESSRKSLAILANKYERIFAGLGIHPHEFNGLADDYRLLNQIKDLENLAENRKVVAVGEIGLDYHSRGKNPISVSQKENQKKGFIAQLEMAGRLNLPAVIHAREAYDDVYKIITRFLNLKFVFHCYAGNLEFTKKLLERDNIYFSFAGNITYLKPASEILKAAKIIPIEKIVLETDCPFLTPIPSYRGAPLESPRFPTGQARNEPAYIVETAKKLAEIKGISFERVCSQTTENARGVFDI